MNTVPLYVCNKERTHFSDGTKLLTKQPTGGVICNSRLERLRGEKLKELHNFHREVREAEEQLRRIDNPKMPNKGVWQVHYLTSGLYKSDWDWAMSFLKYRLSQKKFKFPPRRRREAEWFNSCCLSGLIYCEARENFLGHAYDVSSMYGRALGTQSWKLHLPAGEPKFSTLTAAQFEAKQFKLDKPCIVRCQITCDGARDFWKLFQTSRATSFTNYDIIRARELQKDYPVNITLTEDGNDNLMSYDFDYPAHELFSTWYGDLRTAKNRCTKEGSKNTLIKVLMSGTWGRIVFTPHVTDTSSEFSYLHRTNSGKETWKSTKTFRNIRLQPWLLGCTRYWMSKFVELNADNCCRVATDGAIFDARVEFNSEWKSRFGMVRDEKYCKRISTPDSTNKPVVIHEEVSEPTRAESDWEVDDSESDQETITVAVENKPTRKRRLLVKQPPSVEDTEDADDTEDVVEQTPTKELGSVPTSKPAKPSIKFYIKPQQQITTTETYFREFEEMQRTVKRMQLALFRKFRQLSPEQQEEVKFLQASPSSF